MLEERIARRRDVDEFPGIYEQAKQVRVAPAGPGGQYDLLGVDDGAVVPKHRRDGGTRGRWAAGLRLVDPRVGVFRHGCQRHGQCFRGFAQHYVRGVGVREIDQGEPSATSLGKALGQQARRQIPRGSAGQGGRPRGQRLGGVERSSARFHVRVATHHERPLDDRVPPGCRLRCSRFGDSCRMVYPLAKSSPGRRRFRVLAARLSSPREPCIAHPGSTVLPRVAAVPFKLGLSAGISESEPESYGRSRLAATGREPDRFGKFA